MLCVCVCVCVRARALKWVYGFDQGIVSNADTNVLCVCACVCVCVCVCIYGQDLGSLLVYCVYTIQYNSCCPVIVFVLCVQTGTAVQRQSVDGGVMSCLELLCPQVRQPCS